MFTCPVTKAPVAANHPYPLPYRSARAICPDYAGDTTSLSELTGVFRAYIPGPARPTTPEEEQAQKDTYRGIIHDLVTGYRTDPRETPEVPIAHPRTVIIVEDVVTQRGPSARETRTVISDPTVLHAIDAFTRGYLDLPRAITDSWAKLYPHLTHGDDMLTPDYLESVEEGWALDPTMVTYDDLDWDVLPYGNPFALYSYTMGVDEARAIAQDAQA